MRRYTILNHYTNQTNFKWNCEAEAFGCNHINHLTPWSWVMHIQDTSNCSTLLALRLSYSRRTRTIPLLLHHYHHHHHHHIIFINVIIIIVVVVWLSSDRQQTIIGSDSGYSPNRQTIFWTNDCTVHWRIYTSLGLSDSVNHMLDYRPCIWPCCSKFWIFPCTHRMIIISNRYRHPGMFLPLDLL